MGDVGRRFWVTAATAVLVVFYLFVVTLLTGLVTIGGLDTVLGHWGAVGVVVIFTAVVMAGHYLVGRARILGHLDPRDLPANHPLNDAAGVLSARLGVRDPHLQVAAMGEPNAVAIGGRVIVSAELLRLLDEDEQAAILAHELVHLRHRDTAVQSLGHSVVVMVGGLTYVTFLFVGAIAFFLDRLVSDRFHRHERPDHGQDVRTQSAIAATLLMVVVVLCTRALSRHREYVADERAVAATGDPDALVCALQKIDARAGTADVVTGADSVPPSLCVVGIADSLFGRWFDTHPSMDERIARVRSASGE